MELISGSIKLRAWHQNDTIPLQQQADNLNISRFLFDRFPYPYTIEDAERWIDRQQYYKQLTNFAIVVKGNFAGGIEIIPGDDVHRKNGVMGYWLGEDFWGQGIMTEAVKMIINYAFTKLDLTRIQSSVNANNPASMRVLEKNGFVKEGILKNAILKLDEVMDEHLYGLVK